jgi:MFS family permease
MLDLLVCDCFHLCVFFFFFVSFVGSSCVIVFGITATVLVTRLNLTVIQSAMLSSTSLLFAAFFAVPISLLTSEYGARYICFILELIAGSCLLILAALLQWAPDLPSLYPLFVILALGLGCGVVVVNAGLVQLSWWFPNKYQGTIAGLFLFAVSLGPGIFGAFAFPAIAGMSISGFYLLWACFVYAGALVSLFFGFNSPYTQLHRAMKKKGVRVETLPGASSRNLIDLASSNVSNAQLKAVCKEVFQQEVFPVSSLARDLRLSLTRVENWCVIGIASFSLGSLLGFTVWIPTFYEGVCVFSFFVLFYFSSLFCLREGVFQTQGEASGFIVMGYGLAAAVGCILGGITTDTLSVWLWTIIFSCSKKKKCDYKKTFFLLFF